MRPVMWRDRLGHASGARADKRLQMRVTAGELSVIRSRAALRGLPVADYLLALVAAEILGESAAAAPIGDANARFTPVSTCKIPRDAVEYGRAFATDGLRT